MIRRKNMKKVKMLYTGPIKCSVQGIGQVPGAAAGPVEVDVPIQLVPHPGSSPYNPVNISVPTNLAANLNRDQHWQYKKKTAKKNQQKQKNMEEKQNENSINQR
jgi:hypothetical protein